MFTMRLNILISILISFVALVKCHTNEQIPVKIKPLKRPTFNNKPHQLLNCYSCHDESPYCGDIINNPASIATARCKSKCFTRKQNNKIYRGCYDGWMSTQLKHDYNGCRRQHYMGSTVEWCLCDNDYCNGRSISAMTSGHLGPLQLTTPVRGSKVYRKLQDHVFGFERQPRFRSKQAPGVPYLPRLKHDSRTRTMCSRRYDGIYPDPGNCRGYVDCVAGRAYRRHCSPGTVWSSEARRCDFPDPTSPDSCQAVRFRVQKRRKPLLQPNQQPLSSPGITGFPSRRGPHQRPHQPPNQRPQAPNNRREHSVQRSPPNDETKQRSHFHISKFPVYRYEDGRRPYGSVAAAISGSMSHAKPRYPGNGKQHLPIPQPQVHSNQLQHDHNTQNKEIRQHHHQPQHNNVQLSVRKDLQKKI